MTDFVRFEGDGFVAYVHRETLAAVESPGVVQFNFGAYGWCALVLTSGDEAG